MACPGGLVTLSGRGLLGPDGRVPEVTVGGTGARVRAASPARVAFLLPDEAEGGSAAVRLDTVAGEAVLLEVAETLATGIHQVDNPVFDGLGRLYATYSGSRGEQVPVSIFRITPGGARESFSSGIVNPTSMALGPDGTLYVSSRFEGTVYRLDAGGEASPYVTDVGVPCGLAFGPDGALFIGDRSGTVFRVDVGGKATTIATLPASVAAYHLAVGPDGWIYVSVPTLGTYDHVYRVRDGYEPEVVTAAFGRPQGIAFDADGVLHVVEALAGTSGLYRLSPGGPSELVASGKGLIGVAFGPAGDLVLASNDTLYRFGRLPHGPARH